MTAETRKATRYDLIVFESFARNGQKRYKAHRVGAATPSSMGGFVLYIPAGIALTGRVMMVPEKIDINEIDLLEAYQSAADEHGV